MSPYKLAKNSKARVRIVFPFFELLKIKILVLVVYLLLLGLENNEEVTQRGLYLFSRNFMFCLWPIYSGTSVEDSDPGSSAFLAPGFAIRIRDGKNPDPGSESRDLGSYFRELRNLNFCCQFSVPDTGSVMEIQILLC